MHPTFGRWLQATMTAADWSAAALAAELTEQGARVSGQAVGAWLSDAARPRRWRLPVLLDVLDVHGEARTEATRLWMQPAVPESA